MDSIYYTDDYKIDGCTIKIESPESITKRFAISIYAPKKQGCILLEKYYPMNIAEAVGAVDCLLKRKPVAVRKTKIPQL